MPLLAKICGLGTLDALDAAVAGGAAFAGFVHHPRSSRHVEANALRHLTASLPDHVSSVLVTVDPDDETLFRLLSETRVDAVQLHGRETPRRAADIRARFGVNIIKAFAVAKPDDFDQVPEYQDVADAYLFDAKPLPGAPEGGNGTAFDWSILVGRAFARPWFLSGGLHPGNVAEAARMTSAARVDVSSGVEDAPGVKSTQKIRDFLAAVAML